MILLSLPYFYILNIGLFFSYSFIVFVHFVLFALEFFSICACGDSCADDLGGDVFDADGLDSGDDSYR